MSGFVVCGRASSSSVCGQVSSFVVSGFDVGQAPIPSSPSERREIVFEVKNRHYRQRALPYMRKSPFIHDDELSRCPRQCRTTPTSSFTVSFVVRRPSCRASSFVCGWSGFASPWAVGLAVFSHLCFVRNDRAMRPFQRAVPTQRSMPPLSATFQGSSIYSCAEVVFLSSPPSSCGFLSFSLTRNAPLRISMLHKGSRANHSVLYLEEKQVDIESFG